MRDGCNIDADAAEILLALKELPERIAPYESAIRWVKGFVVSVVLVAFILGGYLFAVGFRTETAVGLAKEAKQNCAEQAAKWEEQAKINTQLLIALKGWNDRAKADDDQKKSWETRLERLERARGWR